MNLSQNASSLSRANAELLGAKGAPKGSAAYALHWRGLSWAWCNSVPLAGAAVYRAVVVEALVHPFILVWGAALRLALLSLQGTGLPHEGRQARS